MAGCVTPTKFRPIVRESPRSGRVGGLRFPLPAVLAIFVLVACASLPDVEDFLSRQTTSPPTIVDGDGRLSVPAAQQVMAGLTDQVGRSQILRKHLADLEAITRRPLVSGNAVSALKDGPSSYAAMFKAVERARTARRLEGGGITRRRCNLASPKRH
jgi:hypothetical protein